MTEQHTEILVAAIRVRKHAAIQKLVMKKVDMILGIRSQARPGKAR